MDGQGENHQSGVRKQRLITVDQHEHAFARVITELEQGEWHLRQWAAELGISEDEMFIEVDRQLHHSAA